MVGLGEVRFEYFVIVYNWFDLILVVKYQSSTL
jgi:hypothetical protein